MTKKDYERIASELAYNYRIAKSTYNTEVLFNNNSEGTVACLIAKTQMKTIEDIARGLSLGFKRENPKFSSAKWHEVLGF